MEAATAELVAMEGAMVEILEEVVMVGMMAVVGVETEKSTST